MSLVTTLATRRPARLAVVSVLGLGVLVGGAAAAEAATAHVRTQSTPLTVRSGPGTQFAAVGSVAKGATITIVCRANGTRVSGRYGATSVWNKLGEGRYVSDAYTTSTQEAPACSEVSPTLVHAGRACSSDEGTYANGRLPRTALCPLRGDEHEALRPRAAAAFNALSTAYAQETGRSLCVTDSYRSYAEQVAVKASRGRWAARPGTSDHGLGRAVDLCGGVERFGTAAHEWMRQNAPRYGWVHPSWAGAGGSLPEPWHWEFVG